MVRVVAGYVDAAGHLGDRVLHGLTGQQRATEGLALDKRGYIVADDATQSTNLPGVFAGGDIVTGGATVILAMAAGRRAARSIATWLQQGKTGWPVDAVAAEAFVAPAAARQVAHVRNP